MGSKFVALLVAVIGVIALAVAGLYLYRHHGAAPQVEDKVATGEQPVAEPPKPGEDTRALPKIWETKSDFEAKVAEFSKVIADHKDKAKTVDELKVAAPLIGKACGNCHEPYRKPAPQQQPAPR